MTQEFRTAVTPTGKLEEVDSPIEGIYKIPAFDPVSGAHYWAVVTTYKWNPETVGKTLLNHESLVAVSPPLCMFCETPYSKLLASQRCKGL